MDGGGATSAPTNRRWEARAGVYQHERLQDNHRYIRLLYLNHQRVWKLENFSLEQPPQYIALSHTWSSSGGQEMIGIDEKNFSVSDTLNQFLKLRHCRSGRWWIDQICIDQQDTSEVSDQVSIMATIYNKAHKVVVWLNDLTEQTRQTLTIDLMRPLLPDCDKFLRGHLNAGVKELFGHKYWARLWIVQELLWARKVEFAYSENKIALQQVRAIFDQSKHIGLPASRAHWLLCEATKLGVGGPENLWRFDELIESLHGCGCKDPRDIVYGVQGLLIPEHRVAINYGEEESAVLFTALKLLIRVWPTARGQVELMRRCFMLAEQIRPHVFAPRNMLGFMRTFGDIHRAYELNPRPWFSDRQVRIQVKTWLMQAFFEVLRKDLPGNVLDDVPRLYEESEG